MIRSERKVCAFVYDMCVCVSCSRVPFSSIPFQRRIMHRLYKTASSVTTGIIFIVLTSVPSEEISTRAGCVELMKTGSSGSLQFRLLEWIFPHPLIVLYPPYLMPKENLMPELNLSLQHLLGCLGLDHPPDATRDRLKSTLSSWPTYLHLHSSFLLTRVWARSIQMVRPKSVNLKVY